MKLRKLATSLLLSLTVLASSFLPAPSAAQAQTTDEEMDQLLTTIARYYPEDIDGHWAHDTLQDLVAADVVKGYDNGDGTYSVKPNNQITRAEFVTLLIRATNLTSSAPAPKFYDVPANTWFTEPVRIAAALGITTGYGGNAFDPHRNIDRDEIAAMVVRAFEATVNWGTPANAPFTDVNRSYWGTSYIDRASSVGIIKGSTATTFSPKSKATRAEALVMLSRSVNLETSALPADNVLTDLVLTDVRERNDAFNSGQYTAITAINDRHSTGEYHASALFSYKMLESLMTDPEIQQMGLQIRFTGTPAARVVQKSNRFAAVELTGVTSEASMVNPETGQRETQTTSGDGLMYLKKMADGSWKIYYSVAKEEPTA